MNGFLNIFLGFIEGLALIVSPCILPILPIVLAGSLTGGRKRPLGIIVGFVLAFALFTFFSRQLVHYSGLDLTIVRYVSYGLLIVLGLIMLSDSLSMMFARATQGLANVGAELSANKKEDFVGGVIFGVLIALVWTPCAGPILAAVIVQTVIQTSTLGSFLVLLAFSIGAAIPMLLIVLFGRAILNRLSIIKENTGLFRKILGLIVIGSVIYLMLTEGTLVALSEPKETSLKQNNLINDISPYPAPALAGIEGWLNSSPLELKNLKGKVILIDFWTYSCINCVRTFPYLKKWYEKYHPYGFEIIGIHSPEFGFEKNADNVKTAIKRHGLTYPIALDNNFVTWENYNNQYWPAHYLINKDGDVVYQHFGEGAYDVTENNIRVLLGLNEKEITPVTERNLATTPETYLGYSRARNYAGQPYLIHNQVSHYTFPSVLFLNQWALQGAWTVESERSVSHEANAAIQLHFKAKSVFAVLGNQTAEPITVSVKLNNAHIKDIQIARNDLFELVSLPKAEEGTLELIADSSGLEIYTFTFG